MILYKIFFVSRPFIFGGSSYIQVNTVIHCCMGNFLGPEEMNDNCGKMAYMGMMDRGFTVVTTGRHAKMTP
jgi:hypothetical protein